MSTTHPTNLEAAFEAVLKKEKLDPAVERKIHDEAAKVRAKVFSTDVAQEALRSFREGDE
jgi:hypothetical protein